MNLTRSKSLGYMVLFGTAVLVVGGCAQPDRLAYDNYTQVRTTVSTEADVAAILGEPDQKMADTWIYQRPDKHLVVMIEFDDKGRVARTQWIDAMGETWHDTTDKK